MQPALRHDQSAATMDELRALNARFIHNFVTRDVASHDALLHPDFINIWPTGQRLDRAAYLKYWATAFDPEVIVYWDVRDELITVVGDVALVRSTNKHTRRRAGNQVTGMTMYTTPICSGTAHGSAFRPSSRPWPPSIIPPTRPSSACISRESFRRGRIEPRDRRSPVTG